MFLYLQLYKEIEICTKDTKVIRFDKAESCTTGYGNLELSTVMFMSIHFVSLSAHLSVPPFFPTLDLEVESFALLH